MSPTNTFEHELIISKDGPVENDALYKSNAVEKVKLSRKGEGSIGCFYVAEGRSSLQKLIEEFVSLKRKSKATNQILNDKINDLRQRKEPEYTFNFNEVMPKNSTMMSSNWYMRWRTQIWSNCWKTSEKDLSISKYWDLKLSLVDLQRKKS